MGQKVCKIQCGIRPYKNGGEPPKLFDMEQCLANTNYSPNQCFWETRDWKFSLFWDDSRKHQPQLSKKQNLLDIKNLFHTLNWNYVS
jgi:hypothetical protein